MLYKSANSFVSFFFLDSGQLCVALATSCNWGSQEFSVKLKVACSLHELSWEPEGSIQNPYHLEFPLIWGLIQLGQPSHHFNLSFWTDISLYPGVISRNKVNFYAWVLPKFWRAKVWLKAIKLSKPKLYIISLNLWDT